MEFLWVPSLMFFVFGSLGTMLTYLWRDDWSDKKARLYTRRWLYFTFIGGAWPLAFPVLFVMYMTKAIKYAFPRQSEE